MQKRLWDLLYLLGRTPWDTRITPPELVEVIEGKQIPAGSALDIGCGTGTNAIYLAQHGFNTVGMDVSYLAIIRARCNARRTQTPVKFYAGDVLTLGKKEGPDIIIPVDFVLDIGCLNSLAEKYLDAYIAMLRRVLRTGGFYMLYAWGPRQWRGRSVGLNPEELVTALESSFRTVWLRKCEEGGAPSYWYLFQRSLS